MKLHEYLFGWKRWGIAASDRVLEIGSGGNPMVRSDVLVDKYVFSDRERELPIARERHLLGGDLVALPFRDKAFDFVYACHIVEHALDIRACMAELCRVGKRGLIVVPGEIYERNFNKQSHHWLIRREGETLVFKPKCACSVIGSIDLQEQWKRRFWHIYVKNRSLFDIHHCWSGSIDYRIEDCTCEALPRGDSELDEVQHAALSPRYRLKRAVLFMLARLVRTYLR
jgi:hypothetical protein